MAKFWADNRIFCTIFVCSEGKVPRIFEGRSSSSRLQVPIEIGDMSHTDAIRYLMDIHKLPEDVSTTFVTEITGGRIMLLEKCAEEYAKTKSIEDVTKIMIGTTSSDFRAAGLLKETRKKESAMSVIKTMLSSPEHEITIDDFGRLAGDHDSLLNFQVFSYHPSKGTVTFQSLLAQRYAKMLLEKEQQLSEQQRIQKQYRQYAYIGIGGGIGLAVIVLLGGVWFYQKK